MTGTAQELVAQSMAAVTSLYAAMLDTDKMIALIFRAMLTAKVVNGELFSIAEKAAKQKDDTAGDMEDARRLVEEALKDFPDE